MLMPKEIKDCSSKSLQLVTDRVQGQLDLSVQQAKEEMKAPKETVGSKVHQYAKHLRYQWLMPL